MTDNEQLMTDNRNLSEAINATKNGLNEQIRVLENEVKTSQDERNSLKNQCMENNKIIESAQREVGNIWIGLSTFVSNIRNGAIENSFC